MSVSSSITFENYLGRLEPGLRRVIRTRMGTPTGRPHPYLSEDDLFQDGVAAVWQVWSRYAETKPVEDLCAMGFSAALRKVSTRRQHAFSRGEGLVNWVDLDAPLKLRTGDTSSTVGEYTPEQGREHERAFLRLAVYELDGLLSEVASNLLGEKLNPGAKTLEAVRKLWTERLSKHTPWHRIDYGVYAEALGVSRKDVRRAMTEIRRKFSALGDLSKIQHVRLLLAERNMTTHGKGGKGSMENGGKKVFVGVPDPMELEEVPAAIHSGGAPTTAVPPDIDLDEAEARRPVARAPAQKAEPKVKAAKAEKKAEPKVKAAKAEKKAKPKPKAKAVKGKGKGKKAKVRIGGAARPRTAGGVFVPGTRAAAALDLLRSKFKIGQSFDRDAVRKACSAAWKVALDSHRTMKAHAGLIHVMVEHKGIAKRVDKDEFKFVK